MRAIARAAAAVAPASGRFAVLFAAVFIALAAGLGAQQGDRQGEVQPDLPKDLVVPPATVRSAADELSTFAIQPGHAVELVAAEPLVRDPIAATFDAAGRLWVVEMRSYMRDVEATAEKTPDGCIAVLHDDDGDGRMDRRTEFLGGLVLPRAVLPLPGGALVVAPPHLLFARDRDGDLVAEGTDVVADGFEAGLQNPEHSGNGLLWALDNRIHLANDARLFRWRKDGVTVETGGGGGQWGIAQDDRGRTYFNYNEDWLRCDLVPGRYAARTPGRSLPGLNHRVVKDTSVWPIRVTPGVNRGYRKGMLQDGVLTRHTAVCAPHVYRGDLLPGARGTVFVCEPAGNLVRQFAIEDGDGAMRGANVFERAEFLASTDERFRPVNLCAGPEGALYVVDMYRGVIQHRNFVTSFLRKQIVARELERPTGLGRIWRIVPAGGVRAPAPRPLVDASTAELVAKLGHRDGWQRDTAQQLLVQRGDPAAVPQVQRLLRDARDPLAQRHALAVLDGLGALQHHDLRRALHGDDPGTLAFALQFVAPRLAQGDGVLWAQCENLRHRAEPTVRWHLALALGDVKGSERPRALRLCAALLAAHPEDAILRGAAVDSAQGSEGDLVRALAACVAGGDARAAVAAEAAAEAAAETTAPVLRAIGLAAGRSRDAARQQDLLTATAALMRSAMQRAVVRGLLDALPKDEERRRGFFVFGATPPELEVMHRTGDKELRALLPQFLAAMELRPEAVAPPPGPLDADLTVEQRGRIAAGAGVYRAICGACHQPDGRGLAGLAPPLADSEWVTGDPDRLVKIALFGIRGPLEAAGVAFEGEMPGHARLSDQDLAAALSWLRRSFGHGRAPIAPEDVARVRQELAGRTETFTAAELADR